MFALHGHIHLQTFHYSYEIVKIFFSIVLNSELHKPTWLIDFVLNHERFRILLLKICALDLKTVNRNSNSLERYLGIFD